MKLICEVKPVNGSQSIQPFSTVKRVAMMDCGSLVNFKNAVISLSETHRSELMLLGCNGFSIYSEKQPDGTVACVVNFNVWY